MIHNEASVLAGQTVVLKENIGSAAMIGRLGGAAFRVEDFWDRISGQSWMDATGNPACLVYAVRSATTAHPTPTDNEVLYGKVGSFSVLVHVSEIV